MTKSFFFFLITIIVLTKQLYLEQSIDIDISYSTEFYDYFKVLVEPDLSILFWSKNQTHILFEIHIRFNGWIVFGLSPNGSLDGSDVIIAWLNDTGAGYFSSKKGNYNLI